jgi:hypothetical protein
MDNTRLKSMELVNTELCSERECTLYTVVQIELAVSWDFEVLTALTVKIALSWDVMSFTGSYVPNCCLSLQGGRRASCVIAMGQCCVTSYLSVCVLKLTDTVVQKPIKWSCFFLELGTATTVGCSAWWVLLCEAVKVASPCSDTAQMDRNVTWEHFIMCDFMTILWVTRMVS